MRSILRKLRFLKMLKENKIGESGSVPQNAVLLSKSLDENIKKIREILGHSNDVGIRKLKFGPKKAIEGAVVFIDGMADKKQINEFVLRPLMFEAELTSDDILNPASKIPNLLESSILTVQEIKVVKETDEIVNAVLSGNTAILINDYNEGLIVDTKGPKDRGVEEPKSEVVIRGPKEGFTETLHTNMALLRRKIKDPNMTFDTLSLGKHTKTDVSIAYIKGVTNPRLVEEIKRRLKDIKTDAILESGYIEEFMEDNSLSLFATIGNSERPDVVASKILEGRAAVLVDGTPFALFMPKLFIEFFQSPEDYYTRSYYGSILRLLRFIAFSLSVILPPAYVALTTFHQELIPTPLLITLAAAREGTPFPAVFEALFMGLIFEVLREAGARMPRQLGQAVSIVGALVIGEAAVSASIIGAPMVIVIATTAVSSFVVINLQDVGIVLRVILTVMAGLFGMFGILIVLLQVLVHLSSIRSFGTPFLSPVAPLSPRDLKDTFIRVPMWAMFTRPRLTGWIDLQRQEFSLMPEKPETDNKQ